MNKLFIKKNLGLIIAIVIGVILFEEANYEYSRRISNINGNHMLYRLILSMGNGSAGLNALFFPVLAALPIGVSYVREYKSGYLKLILQRESLKKYVIKKLCLNIIYGGISLVVPYILYCIHLYVQLGTKAELVLDKGNTVIMFCPELANENMLLYLVVIGAFVFNAGAVFATFSIGISAWVKNEFLSLALPFALCIAVAIVTPDMKWDLLLLYSPNGYEYASIAVIIIISAFMYLMGAMMFIFGVKKNEQDNRKDK